MIIAEINGGLGNQLFQYANGLAIAKKTNQELMLDLSMFRYGCGREYQLDKLKIEPYRAKVYYTKRVDNKYIRVLIKGTQEIIKRIRMIGFSTINDSNSFQIPDVGKSKNIYIKGHWISHKYFEDYENDVRNSFQLKEKSESLNEFIKEASKENSVALHVRRGDYTKLGWCLPNEYYYHAIQQMENLLDNELKYYIFTDDLEFSKQLFTDILKNKSVVYVKEKFELSDIEELFAIAACKNQIIANSTFSWWGAWLNANSDKKVIAPRTTGWDYNRIPVEWNLVEC